MEGLDQSIGEKYMFPCMGGEVEEVLKDYLGKVMKCLGVCGKNITIRKFRGYPHDNGLADAAGQRWWVYVHCDRCKYDTSWGKIGRQIEQAKMM
jgi:hypothetical protein